jgi:hypothetical protein
MICKECQESGRVSRVFERGGVVTALAHQAYFDEQGRRHSHDPNVHSQSYSCSNGHNWTTGALVPCWCGWPDKEQP